MAKAAHHRNASELDNLCAPYALIAPKTTTSLAQKTRPPSTALHCLVPSSHRTIEPANRQTITIETANRRNGEPASCPNTEPSYQASKNGGASNQRPFEPACGRAATPIKTTVRPTSQLPNRHNVEPPDQQNRQTIEPVQSRASEFGRQSL